MANLSVHSFVPNDLHRIARHGVEKKKNGVPLPVFTNCRFHIKIQNCGDTSSIFLHGDDGLEGSSLTSPDATVSTNPCL
jgi:hypothetical protein